MSNVHYPPQQTMSPPQNGLGTAGFVLGLIGLIFSPIPFIGVVAWPLVILGLIFSLIGLGRAAKGRATNKGLAVAGVVVSVVGLVICILWVAAFNKAVDDLNKESNREATIRYEISGDAKNAVVTYSVWGETITQNQETAATLPWVKDVTTKGLAKGGTLTASVGVEGGAISCKVVVDGKEAKTGAASGPFASVTCGGF